MQIESTNGSYRDLEVEAIAIAVFKDERADDGFLKDLDSVTGGVHFLRFHALLMHAKITICYRSMDTSRVGWSTRTLH